ncbi:MAG: ExbD/TolR family protein [Halanaerobiaceae bacterium]
MFKPTHNKKTSINIIPLIDVIFFLLVFFMLFTSFRTAPEGLEMQLPEAVTVTEQDQENLVIYINKDGDFYFQDEEMNIGQLSSIIEEEYNNNDQITVIINADRETRYKDVVTVMDNVRELGIYNLALAAERKE